MNRIIIIFAAAMVFSFSASAQEYFGYSQSGEFGVTFGGAHYFGDLNNRAAFNRPKPAAGIFFRKQFNNYISARLTAHFAQVGYSDVYSKNEYQRLRNLSFNSNIYEVALLGDFNFFKFTPDDPAHSFTPYVTLGVGVFNFDPYAYYNGRKIFLRPLGTEGQNLPSTGKKPYSTTALCIPFGVGIKYNLTQKINISFEITHRFTRTDYLDDVSSVYVDDSLFPSGPPDTNGNPTRSDVQLLADRSYEINNGKNYFSAGQQRGFSKQKDQYTIAEIGVSFNISTYHCPTAN